MGRRVLSDRGEPNGPDTPDSDSDGASGGPGRTTRTAPVRLLLTRVGGRCPPGALALQSVDGAVSFALRAALA
ncbi:FUSC family protein, partial [Streptomyces sp. SID4931]|nr:FUSC family protein [Streptomyces sp. SID4931]